MTAICDVKEYRSAVCGRGARAAPAPAHALFDALHALCNLLLVKPENLQQVCVGETLVSTSSLILELFTEKLSSALDFLDVECLYFSSILYICVAHSPEVSFDISFRTNHIERYNVVICFHTRVVREVPDLAKKIKNIWEKISLFLDIFPF